MSSANQTQTGRFEHNEERCLRGRTHDEQCVQYTHEMPYDLKEATGRVVIRLVPILYGFLFGSLTGDMPVTMSIGFAVSAAMDLGMGDKSLFQGLFRPLLRGGCPLVALLARASAHGINGIGLKAPKALGDMRCSIS